MIHYFTLNTIIELICFIISLICLIKIKSLAWKSQILFLLIICVIEFTGIYVKGPGDKNGHHHHPNSWVYNIFLIFQMLFMTPMLAHFLRKYTNSKPLLISGLALLILLYIFEFFKHGFFVYNNTTNIVMSGLFVLYSLYYYYYLFKDNIYVDLKYSAEFWWVAGVLFFYFGRTACMVFYDKLDNVIIAPGHYLTYYIYNVLNILLYGCWCYSFICIRWLTKALQN